ncbi:hypothetical protein [Brevundimonas sp.]
MTDVVPDPEIPRIQIQLNVDAAVGPIQWSARRAAQMLTILLPRLDEHDFGQDIEIGPQISRMTIRAWADPAEDRTHLEVWLLAAIFQELSRGVRASLEEACLFTRLAALDPSIPRPATIIEDVRREVALLHTPVLLQSVNASLGGQLGFVAEMEALNRGRNCLEHGRGIVRERDCDDGEQAMRVTMPYFALCRRDRDGSVVDVEFGVPLPEGNEGDGMVELMLERRSHAFEFRLGEPFRISRPQLEAMIMGCHLLAVDLGAQLHANLPKADELAEA